MPIANDLSKAKNCALRLIKFRLRSQQEIRDKLKQKAFSAEIIEAVVAFLKKAGLLDDALFARLWVSSRLKRSVGLRRLRYELKKKGIDKTLIEKAIADLPEGFSEDEAIQEIVALKLKKMRGLKEDKIKSRLYGFLLRRGYPEGKAYEAVMAALKPSVQNET